MSPLCEGLFLLISAGERYENHFDFGGIAKSGTIIIFTISKSKNATSCAETTGFGK